MNTNELREKYEENNEIIKKLRGMLKTSTNEASTKLIIESIDKVLEEQKALSNSIRKNIYGSLRKKAMSSLMTKVDDKTEVLTSSKKATVSDDITEVLTSDMKTDSVDDNIIDYEDEIIEVDDFVDKFSDDKTDVLTSDMKVNPDIYKDAKIEFNGVYTLYYDNGNRVYTYNLDEGILKHNYEINGTYDFNIIHMLKTFDGLNNTKLYDRYMQNKLPVHYDLEKAKNNRINSIKLSSANLNKIKTIAAREKEDSEFTNVTVKNIKKNNFRVIAATIGVAALTLVGALGFGKKNTEQLVDNSNKNISTTLDVKDAGVTDADYESVELSNTSMISSDIDSITLEETEEDVTTVEDTEDILEEEVSEIMIGDVVQFSEDIDLYYASTDVNPRGNTSYITEKDFRVGFVSIVKDNQVIDLIYNSDDSIEKIKEDAIKKYGDDVIVSINYDSLDSSGNEVTEKLGWSDGEEIGKILVKE